MSGSLLSLDPPLPALETQVGNRGSLVVKVSDSGWHATSSSPVPLKSRRVGRGAMHVKSVESSNFRPLMRHVMQQPMRVNVYSAPCLSLPYVRSRGAFADVSVKGQSDAKSPVFRSQANLVLTYRPTKGTKG
ncbi:hypothetical protein TNCV_3015481 [Trichonephila clavipes]|nr:hypothetical protein TNCV_3015481 [Trichonephila clavipes]